MSLRRIILASRSPRRLALLREAGYQVDQVAPPLDDSIEGESGSGAEVAESLARAKLRSFLDHKRLDSLSDALIIAADTVVVSPQGLLLGQPRDASDARAMLLGLLDRAHEVVTAVAIRADNHAPPAILVDTAHVTLHHPGPTTLKTYLESGQWRGKAGAYNLYELTDAWRPDVVGDPTTVVGLPMAILQPALARWFGRKVG